MSVYSGELEVLGGAFILDANRLVIRDREVAFKLAGVDGDGEFQVEGISTLTSNGRYVSNNLKVEYTGYSGKDDAIIQFNVIKPTEKKLRCYVEGRWLRGIEVWPFSGNLRLYKSK